MKRNLFFVIGAMLLMMAGTMMTACSSDDDVVKPETPVSGYGTRQLPKQADFVKSGTLKPTIMGQRFFVTVETSSICMTCLLSIRKKV